MLSTNENAENTLVLSLSCTWCIFQGAKMFLFPEVLLNGSISKVVPGRLVAYRRISLIYATGHPGTNFVSVMKKAKRIVLFIADLNQAVIFGCCSHYFLCF